MPFLSATERIIREAEAAEARRSAAAEGPAPAGVAAPWSQPTPVPDAVTGPMFADGYLDYDDLSDGVTRVDLNRSALALEKLRAFDSQSSPAGARQAALGTGTSPSPLPPQPASTDARAASAAESASRPRRGPPPGRPTPPSEASWTDPPEPRTSSAALREMAAPVAEPPLAAHRSRSISLRHSPRVGRRLGLVIAAVTAAAVAPLVGSWTSRFENAASARGGAEAPSIGSPIPSSPAASAAPPPIAAMVVPSASPDPAPRASASAQRPVLPLDRSGKAPDSPESASSSDPNAKDRLLGAVEPRPTQKSNGGKKPRHRAHQTKVSTVPAPRAVAPRPAGPSSGPVRHDARSSGDPDDTLPIAVE